MPVMRLQLHRIRYSCNSKDSLPKRNRNIQASANREAVHAEALVDLNEQQRLAFINVVGLATLATFTGLVYLRTQEPLILIVGGLISVVGVLGMMTGKT